MQDFVLKCETCQRFANFPIKPPSDLINIVCSVPFVEWRIDLIGHIPKGKGNNRYAVVTIDYFTKWVEAKPLTSITKSKMVIFVWKNLISKIGILKKIITDNGTQFDCKKFKLLCEEYGIQKAFSTPIRPQANGLVEAVNKSIKCELKTRLGDYKGA